MQEGGRIRYMPKAPRYKGVVFDFDGTIIDTMGSFCKTAAHVMNKHYGISLQEGRRLYIETSGIPFYFQLEELFPGNIKNPLAAGEFEHNKMKGISSENFFPEVRTVINRLRTAGIVVAVSSNNFPENVNRLLNEGHIEVDVVLGYSPGFYKGDPHFSAIKKMWNLEKRDILYVGDSLKDAHWARERGVEFIARIGTIPEERFRKDFPEFKLVHNLQPLPTIILGGSEHHQL